MRLTFAALLPITALASSALLGLEFSGNNNLTLALCANTSVALPVARSLSQALTFQPIYVPQAASGIFNAPLLNLTAEHGFDANVFSAAKVITMRIGRQFCLILPFQACIGSVNINGLSLINVTVGDPSMTLSSASVNGDYGKWSYADDLVLLQGQHFSANTTALSITAVLIVDSMATWQNGTWVCVSSQAFVSLDPLPGYPINVRAPWNCASPLPTYPTPVPFTLSATAFF
jgi:hypothetical protein